MEETKKLIQNFNEIEKQVRESIEKSIIEKIGFDNYLQLSETCIYIDEKIDLYDDDYALIVTNIVVTEISVSSLGVIKILATNSYEDEWSFTIDKLSTKKYIEIFENIINK